MNIQHMRQLIEAVLYEGHILYPYRPSAKKNSRERFTFGRVYPEAYAVSQDGLEPSVLETECLLTTASDKVAVQVSVGFLQPQAREIGSLDQPSPGASPEPGYRLVPELRVEERVFQPWVEAVERTIACPLIQTATDCSRELIVPFDFPAAHELEQIQDRQGFFHGVVARRRERIQGRVEIRSGQVTPGVMKLTVCVHNTTPVSPPETKVSDVVSMRTFSSTHALLSAAEGEFLSSLDPPAHYRHASGACRNRGLWPVLVGDETLGERATMLASPIILYDYPKIAAESAGPLFDGTEIDEILTLRILTMTDGEKLEMRHVDEQARRLLERTERLEAADLLRMHGIMRPSSPREPVEYDDFFNGRKAVQRVKVGGNELHAGDRVRIHPKGRADVMDIALKGRTAVIEAIEEDLENRIHLALVLDDDPGRELGLQRQTGHRFFFGPDEVEAVE